MNGYTAQKEIRSMIDNPTKETHPYRDEDIYSISATMLRDIICGEPEKPTDMRDYTGYPDLTDTQVMRLGHTWVRLDRFWKIILDDEYSMHFRSELKLEFSLCPMHDCDYAACFDDDEPDCRLIRQYFPRHDT